MLEDLDGRFPGLRFRIVDEQGEVRTHMRVFVNGKDVASLRTRVGEDDEVRIEIGRASCRERV